VRAGLADPVADSQAIFRAVLEAMARPGRIVDVPHPPAAPPPLDPATAGVCLTLVDFETPLWLDSAVGTPEVVEYLRFHCGARIAKAPERATFALVVAPRPALDLHGFEQGTDEEPERSATVIVQVAGLSRDGGCCLTGPGIAGEAWLRADGLTPAFWASVRDNHAGFPRGVDLVLVAGTRLAALPRSTRVEIA
jgi:alpha-D-ribose 1-methylphosphonate 5-triphosphate synthase subunit PhnH